MLPGLPLKTTTTTTHVSTAKLGTDRVFSQLITRSVYYYYYLLFASMGRSCAVFECTSTTGLHAFPKNRERVELWLRAMGRSLSTNTTKMFVCNRHFSSDSYDNYGMFQMGMMTESQLRLKEDSVPKTRFSLASNAVSFFCNVCILSC